MDDYIEQLLERSKARKEFLKDRKVTEIRKRSALVDENQINQFEPDLNEELDDSPKRQCVEYDELENSGSKNENDKENADEEMPYVPYVATETRGLAALRKSKAVSSDASPRRETASRRSTEYKVNKRKETSPNHQTPSHKSRFAALAANIREWEDDDDHHKPRSPAGLKTSVSLTVSSSSSNIPVAPSVSSSSNTSVSSSLTVSESYSSAHNFSKLNTGGGNSLKHVSFHTNCDKDVTGKRSVHDNSVPKSHSNLHDTGFKKKEVFGKTGISDKIQAWDKAVLTTLESQGFVRSPSASKLSYKFSKNERKEVENVDSKESESSDEEKDERQKSPTRKISQNKVITTAKFESPKKKAETFAELQKTKSPVSQIESNQNRQECTDPAELPLSARKAIFEKKFFGSAEKSNAAIEANLSVAQRAAMFEKAAKFEASKSTPKEPSRFPQRASNSSRSTLSSDELKSPVKIVTSTATLEMKISKSSGNNASPTPKFSPNPKFSPTPKEAIVLSPSKNAGIHTRLVQQRLIENSANDWKKKDAAKGCEDRKNEISALLNLWEKKSTSFEPDTAEVEPQQITSNHTSSETEVQSSFSTEPQNDSEAEGTSESDEESSDEEQSSVSVDNNHSNVSELVEKEEEYNITRKFKSLSENFVRSVADDTINICDEINESILEAEEIVDEVWEPQTEILPPPLPPAPTDSGTKSSKCSSDNSGGSVSSQNEVHQYRYCSPGTVQEYDSGADSDLPLLHTVSFYRRQKQEKRSTPVRTIVRRETVSSPPSPEVDCTKLIQEKIKVLQEEILRQQEVISQTSRALNLCHATEEFYGSTEQVEFERHLLIATQKRQAYISEIHRLKTHGALGKTPEDGNGTLTIHDIKLPLKRDFLLSQLENKTNDAVHYFLCLVRYGHQIIVTEMLSTDPKDVTNGSLCFSNLIKLHELPPDFNIVFEVYALQTKKEVLPHEKKYHIKKEHSKMRLTPKGKKSDSKLLMPAISSPGGPNAVRTPSFGVVGYTRFTIQNCNRKTCTLDKVPFSSPLDGVLLLKMKLHSEHNIVEKGFLTMFEDVSGFGAWHRRWCVLDGRDLLFWKYPDDERRKNPILQIDLRQCITNQVKLVSRDVCARAHTFELVTVRPQEEGDRNTLISRSVNTLTTTKYLLSADTKEERIMWCKRLNEALTNVRKWDPQALRPVDMKQ